MKYALVDNDSIKVGPRTYHPAFFKKYLDRQNIVFELPDRYDSVDTIQISDTVKIVKVMDPDIPEYDSLTEQLAGPYWDVLVEPITGTYSVADQTIESMRSNAKEIVASNRYNNEIAGVDVDINGTTVHVSTARDDRHIWIQAMLLMDDVTPQAFKFDNNIWLNLLKADIQTIINAIMAKVQSAFDWESGKVAEIDAATTKAEIQAIDLVLDPPTEDPII